MNNILGQHDPLSVWHCNKWSIDYLQPNRSPWRAPKRGFEWYSGEKCGCWMLTYFFIGHLFLSVWQPNTKLIFWLFGPKMYLYGFVKKGGMNDIPWMFWGKCKQVCLLKWKQAWFQVQTSEAAGVFLGRTRPPLLLCLVIQHQTGALWVSRFAPHVHLNTVQCSRCGVARTW